MGSYCAAIWRCRYFWLSLVKMDLRKRYRGSVLGLGWSLLHPIAMTAIFTVVFSTVFQKNPLDYAPYVLSGLACWTFILNSGTNGCQCFFEGESYIRQHPAPLAIYPLRTVLGMLFHFLIALLVAFTLAFISVPVWRQGGSYLALLSLPFAYLLMGLLGWSVAVLTGLMTVYFRDMRQIVELGFQALFYLTPVFYEDRQLSATLQQVMRLNPVLPFLKMVRAPLLHGTLADWTAYAKGCIVVALAMSLAIYALSKLERRLIFHL
jgi:ABC-type polysaccharide/polyol phosphate export permease